MCHVLSTPAVRLPGLCSREALNILPPKSANCPIPRRLGLELLGFRLPCCISSVPAHAKLLQEVGNESNISVAKHAVVA